jgi:hypothetical protein
MVSAGTKAYDFACPLNSILANCENLFAGSPAVRIQLTTKTFCRCFGEVSQQRSPPPLLAVLVSAFDMVGPEVDAVVSKVYGGRKRRKLIIKSPVIHLPPPSCAQRGGGTLSILSTSVSSSIKSIFLLPPPPTIMTAVWRSQFFFKGHPASLGSYQYFIWQRAYPQRPLDATCKPGTLWNCKLGQQQFGRLLQHVYYFVNTQG